MIIFLDFDGVLHPFFPLPDNTDEQNAHFCDVPALAGVLARHPDVKVVVTSSWRNKYDIPELKKLLGPVVGARVVGKTPSVQSSNSPGARAREIEMYLAASDDPTQLWVALDDMEDLFDPSSPLIVCPDGLKFDQLKQLDQVLSHPSSPVQRRKFGSSFTSSGLWVPPPR